MMTNKIRNAFGPDHELSRAIPAYPPMGNVAAYSLTPAPTATEGDEAEVTYARPWRWFRSAG